MKKSLIFLLYLFFMFFNIFGTKVFAINELNSNDTIRIICKSDQAMIIKENSVVSTIFTFTIKDNKLYGREGELVKKFKITDEGIKGKLKYRHGFSWENTRFQINRYTGAFNYHTIYRTLEGASQIINSGMCSKIESEQQF